MTNVMIIIIGIRYLVTVVIDTEKLSKCQIISHFEKMYLMEYILFIIRHFHFWHKNKKSRFLSLIIRFLDKRKIV